MTHHTNHLDLSRQFNSKGKSRLQKLAEQVREGESETKELAGRPAARAAAVMNTNDNQGENEMAVNLTELRNFISARQLAAMRVGLAGEEGAHFREKLTEFSERARSMPKIYEQDGMGKNAVAHLHYFLGGHDWYITERDFSAEQLQAFGRACLMGNDPELGYISIAELIAHGVELDLYFTPTPLCDLPSRCAA